jgi:hypothetical protein
LDQYEDFLQYAIPDQDGPATVSLATKENAVGEAMSREEIS